jgi:dihydroorotate dehydrogenase (fumarate)
MRVRYANIQLSHPVIAASAGTTRDAEQAVKCEDAGYSAVVLKSVQEETLMRFNPFPRFKVLRSGVPGYESTTFYSYEQAYYGDLDQYADTVRRSKERVDIPVVASINCIRPDSWAQYAVACEQAGADAIEIVPSCPSGKLMRDPSHDLCTIALGALAAVKRAVKIPVVPKMTGQVANVLDMAVRLAQGNADGLTMINRATGIDIDVNARRPILHGGFAGHGGSWALPATLRWIISAWPLVEAPISATGGVMTGEDAVKCLLAGASSVQVCAVMYLKGYDWVRTMLEQIEAYMRRHDISALSDIIGAASRNMLTMERYDRVTRYTASCDRAACTRCARCAPVCIYDAIGFVDGKCMIDPQKCDGCGLCVSVCRFGAISIAKREE